MKNERNMVLAMNQCHRNMPSNKTWLSPAGSTRNWRSVSKIGITPHICAAPIDEDVLIIETKAPTGIGAEKSFVRIRKLTRECAHCKILSAVISQTLLEFPQSPTVLWEGRVKPPPYAKAQLVAEAPRSNAAESLFGCRKSFTSL